MKWDLNVGLWVTWNAYCAVIGELALYVVMTLHLAGFLVPLDFSHTTSLETHASNTYPSPGVIIHAKVMTMAKKQMRIIEDFVVHTLIRVQMVLK